MSRFTWLDTLEMVIRVFLLLVFIFILSVFVIYISDLVESIVGQSFLDYLKHYFSRVELFFSKYF